jgi:hypothetical protein
MLSWLFWPLERIERIHAAAGAFVSEFGVEAYAEARRQERAANSDKMARDWRCVASVVARRMSKRAGLDIAARPPPPESGSADEPERIVSEPQPFRIQFVCGTPDCRPTYFREEQIQAADTSAAILAAASARWPPQTIGLRILNREGREVFARRRDDRRRFKAAVWVPGVDQTEEPAPRLRRVTARR